MYTSILEALDRACDRYPQDVIYRDPERALTFSELNQKTRAIGSFLSNAISPGEPVAVLTGRHVMTPAAYLGVLRAGCFYAPMDADVPDRRLNQVLSVLGADHMIVDREHLEKAQALDFDGELILLEEILDTPVDDVRLSARQDGVTETSPMYVIFTSGSTGIPKGVVTSHFSLMCYLDAIQDVLHLDDTDALGSQSPLDYIAGVRDMYLPLLSGASTYLIPKSQFAMPEELFSTLNEQRVTTLCWSCAGLEIVSKMGGFEDSCPQYLKRVIFSGSVIANRHLKVWQEHLPECTFINQYGPTEATASCTYHILEDTVQDDTVIPIGKPYKHYDVFLLSESEDGNTFSHTPTGEIGEICVRGPILALGYYNNPEATNAAFPQDPFHERYPSRIYRTGDLGRIGEDGLLYFCGRKDRQVKHLGHRIELEEIEAAARAVEGVEECSALYNKEKALLCLAYTGTAEPRGIVLAFRKDMPAYMVPRKLKHLDTLPRLPNGKPDYVTIKTMF